MGVGDVGAMSHGELNWRGSAGDDDGGGEGRYCLGIGFI